MISITGCQVPILSIKRLKHNGDKLFIKDFRIIEIRSNKVARSIIWDSALAIDRRIRSCYIELLLRGCRQSYQIFVIP